jgi:hypothetical protein
MAQVWHRWPRIDICEPYSSQAHCSISWSILA